jgi:hypothetical protein
MRGWGRAAVTAEMTAAGFAVIAQQPICRGRCVMRIAADMTLHE